MLRKLEIVTNIAIILITILFATLIATRYRDESPPTPSPAATNIPVASEFRVDGVEWSLNSRNLVLAFSTKCPFCLDSTDLYNRLAERHHGAAAFRFIVLSPEPVDHVNAFFASRQIEVDEVHQVRLSDVSIRGTPTLVLVGADGLVKNSWVGKLPESAESEVFEAVFSEQSGS